MLRIHRTTIQLLLALAVTSILVACSNPRDTALPRDLSQIESIRPAIEKLPQDEKGLLAAYLARHAVAASFGGLLGSKTEPIPEGMTIGKAIEEQRKWAADQKAREDAEKALRAKVQAEREAAVKQMRDTVTVTLVDKKLQSDKGYSGITLDEKLVIQVAYQNNTDKIVAGVKGTITIKDLFGDKLSEFLISYDRGIPPNFIVTWTGERSVKFGFSPNKDRKVAELPFDKLSVEWEPEMIVFEDGKSLKAN